MSQRLFIGVALDDRVREAIARGIADARNADVAPAGLRWLEPESWHVTLQFLGAVDDAAIEPLCRACAEAAREVPPFEIELGASGAFASPRLARVLWIGVAAGREQLGLLAVRVIEATRMLGFAPEDRAFNAHVTIARARRPGSVERLLPRLQPQRVRMSVAELCLFRSQLSQAGARYEVIGRFALGS
jgi:2'-5' RNA ligase